MEKERIGEFIGQLEERRYGHLRYIEQLETNGVNMDVLTDIYGLRLYDDGDIESTRILKRYQQLQEAVGSEKRFMMVLKSASKLKPGCYGFGAQPQYTPYLSAVILDKTLADTAISYEKNVTSQNAAVFVDGAGYTFYPSRSAYQPHGEYNEFEQADQIHDQIAAGDRISIRSEDLSWDFAEVLEADSIKDLSGEFNVITLKRAEFRMSANTIVRNLAYLVLEELRSADIAEH